MSTGQTRLQAPSLLPSPIGIGLHVLILGVHILFPSLDVQFLEGAGSVLSDPNSMSLTIHTGALSMGICSEGNNVNRGRGVGRIRKSFGELWRKKQDLERGVDGKVLCGLISVAPCFPKYPSQVTP